MVASVCATGALAGHVGRCRPPRWWCPVRSRQRRTGPRCTAWRPAPYPPAPAASGPRAAPPGARLRWSSRARRTAAEPCGLGATRRATTARGPETRTAPATGTSRFTVAGRWVETSPKLADMPRPGSPTVIPLMVAECSTDSSADGGTTPPAGWRGAPAANAVPSTSPAHRKGADRRVAGPAGAARGAGAVRRGTSGVAAVPALAPTGRAAAPGPRGPGASCGRAAAAAAPAARERPARQGPGRRAPGHVRRSAPP